jgi:hypothetical protein
MGHLVEARVLQSVVIIVGAVLTNLQEGFLAIVPVPIAVVRHELPAGL